MLINWQADDGYVGKDRPQHTVIDDEEILECETVQEAMDFIEECIADDFSRKVSPGYDWMEVKERVKDLLKFAEESDA